MRPYATTRVKKISHKQKERLGALADVRKKWWAESQESGEPLMCAICNEPIVRFSDLASDHEIPGKMGGCRDDDENNLRPTHSWCNKEKSSQRNFVLGRKLVPRKPGRMMKKSEIDFYLNELKCFCGKPKNAERPCCLECWAKLADQLKLDLSRKGSELPTFVEYQELLREVELQILSLELTGSRFDVDKESA